YFFTPISHSFPTRRSSDLASADSPVLLRQVFSSNFGYSIGRYFLQLLYEPSHCFKGGYHLEDSYDKALACDPVQGVSVLGLDLRSEEHTSELQSRFDLVCR